MTRVDPYARSVTIGEPEHRTLAEALGGHPEVVVLNDAPPLLIHRVLGNKLALVDGDPQARANLESDALIRYLDTMPLREELSRGLEQRMEAGSFGRSTKG